MTLYIQTSLCICKCIRMSLCNVKIRPTQSVASECIPSFMEDRLEKVKDKNIFLNLFSGLDGKKKKSSTLRIIVCHHQASCVFAFILGTLLVLSIEHLYTQIIFISSTIGST